VTRIQDVRLARGWSQTALAMKLRQRGQQLGTPVGSTESLKTQISRWENGKVAPGDFHRQLLREVLNVSDEGLGFAPAGVSTALTSPPSLTQALGRAALFEAGSTAHLHHQVEAIRKADGQSGAADVLEYARKLLDDTTQQRRYLVQTGAQRELAAVTADLASLVGWQSLDVGDLDRAWTAFEEAKSAAREAEDNALLAHATGEQSFALLDLGRGRDGADMVAEARQLRGLPPRLTAWLHAAEAENRAAAGDGEAARRSLAAAESLLPSSDDDAALTPYLRLDAANLTRWRGHCLGRRHDPSAVDELLEGLASVRGRYSRAEASVLVDLAAAELHRDDRDQAQHYLRQATSLANRMGSVRQRRRLEALRQAA
jgi:transcriptional regulator with XRE-family HTH domain